MIGVCLRPTLRSTHESGAFISPGAYRGVRKTTVWSRRLAAPYRAQARDNEPAASSSADQALALDDGRTTGSVRRATIARFDERGAQLEPQVRARTLWVVSEPHDRDDRRVDLGRSLTRGQWPRRRPLMLILALSVGACSGKGPQADATTPARAANAYLEATADGDKSRECALVVDRNAAACADGQPEDSAISDARGALDPRVRYVTKVKGGVATVTGSRRTARSRSAVLFELESVGGQWRVASLRFAASSW